VIVIVCLLRYSITKAIENQIGTELEQRRRSYGATPSLALPGKEAHVAAVN
jgi:hypothetical protein